MDKSFCFICGRRDDLTQGHIVPKCIFPKPRPSNLIALLTADECSSCNSGSSKDDEYFKTCLVAAEKTVGNDGADKVLDSIQRNFCRPEAHGFRAAFLASTEQVELTSSAGLYLRDAWTYAADKKRLFSVVERAVRGLFYKQTKRRMASEYRVSIHTNQTLGDLSIDDRNMWLAIANNLFNTQAVVIDEDVFRYHYMIQDNGDSCLSAWLLVFYNTVRFVVVTRISAVA